MKIPLALVIVGIILIIHALGRSDRTNFDNGSFLGVIAEGLAGLACLVAAVAIAVFGVFAA